MCLFGIFFTPIYIYRISIASAMLVLILIKYCVIFKNIDMFFLCYIHSIDVFLNKE